MCKGFQPGKGIVRLPDLSAKFSLSLFPALSLFSSYTRHFPTGRQCAPDRLRKKTTARHLPGIVVQPMLVAACLIFHTTPAAAADPAPMLISSTDLSRMTLEELANIEIYSASRKRERLSDTPAAAYVITREDIRRSGANSVPEILRLAPNLQVARVDASQYAITARGFNSTTANKLLVMIDGRSVYTPLFSGVFWDVQDVMVEDIERIEVISGAGGTLWGANAVNGVINIIRKKSSDTQGGLTRVGAGNAGHGAAVRHGGRLGEDSTYHVYGRKIKRDNTVQANGTAVEDAWHIGQFGFRMDLIGGIDDLKLQGDAYDGDIDQNGIADKDIEGANLLARWRRTLEDGTSLRVQTYYDHTQRSYPGLFGESLDIFDIDLQHSWRWRTGHNILWGGGYRYARDEIVNSDRLAFLPSEKTLTLANVFAQDEITLAERVKLTIGLRLERNTYTGLENQPSLRLAWKPNDETLVWSSIARAVRTPSRIDRDFYTPANPVSPTVQRGLNGGPDFQSEKLTAYEIGYKTEPSTQTSLSISTFYNDYDKLRSIEPTGGTNPDIMANMMEGHTHGIETWGSLTVREGWQIKAGYNYLKKNLRLKPGSGDTITLNLVDTDPRHQFLLRSLLNLTHNLDLDLALRSVSRLRGIGVPGYVELNGRVGWRIVPNMELSLSGFNLLDKQHPEFVTSSANSEIGRAFFLKMLWNF